MALTVQNKLFTVAPEFQKDRLKVHYTVSNQGSVDLYVLDVLPGYDTEAKKPVANYKDVYVGARPGCQALILRGIPPLPADRMVAVRLIPLGTKVPPGGQLERTVELELPLKETSPYYLPLKPEEYQACDLTDITFAVQTIKSNVEGFTATEAMHGPGLYVVRSKNIVGQAESLEYSFKAPPKEKLLKRTDRFTRL